ncbi:MAG: hypothetical protein HS100_22790 [Anaerolineales bacterium]|nr:hypothetical protein [Anaerolineales bacterium]
MFPQIFTESVLWASRIIYGFLVVYYLGMLLLANVLIIRQLIVRLLIKILHKSSKQLAEATIKKKASLGEVFRKSLLLNDILAVSSIFLGFVLVTLISFPKPEYKSISIALIVSVIPYIWGFKRSTGVGVNSGTIGAMFGLFWLAYKQSPIVLWEQTPYFLALNIIANLSGWIGGFVGLGQIRESASVSLFEFSFEKETHQIPDLIEKIKKSIGSVFIAKTNGEFVKQTKQPEMTLAHLTSTDSYSFISLRNEMEWRKGYRPQVMALKWLFEKGLNIYSINQIIDNVFNVWRYTTSRAILLISHDLLFSSGAKSRDNSVQLFVMSYKETPSIIWTENDVEILSNDIYQRLLKDAKKYAWKIKNSNFFTLQRWASQATLEQYSKNTLASNNPMEFVKNKNLSNIGYFPKSLHDEFSSMTTFFDKIRGRTATFVTFLIAQVFVALLINWLNAGVNMLIQSGATP